MPDLQDLSKTLSIFSGGCNSASGEYFPFIHPDESLYVTQTCENKFDKDIITCKSLYSHEFVEEVKGLALDTTIISTIQELPFYIPIYNKRIMQLPNISSNFPFIGLTLKDVLPDAVYYKAGGIHESKSINFRALILQALCFKNSKVILFSSGTDTLIEFLWREREDCDLYSMVTKSGFYAMTGFNFSIIEGECAFAQTLNIKRSLYSAYEMEQSGLLTIPHVYALTSFQIKRWIEWFKQNPKVTYFTINCQLQKSEKDVLQVVKTVIEIFKVIPYIHVILQGFRSPFLQYFGYFIDRIHIAETSPINYAQANQQLFFDLETLQLKRKYAKTVLINELIENNFIQKSLYIKHLRSGLLAGVKKTA